jgi:hypothetical protein
VLWWDVLANFLQAPAPTAPLRDLPSPPEPSLSPPATKPRHHRVRRRASQHSEVATFTAAGGVLTTANNPLAHAPRVSNYNGDGGDITHELSRGSPSCEDPVPRVRRVTRRTVARSPRRPTRYALAQTAAAQVALLVQLQLQMEGSGSEVEGGSVVREMSEARRDWGDVDVGYPGSDTCSDGEVETALPVYGYPAAVAAQVARLAGGVCVSSPLLTFRTP